MAKDEEGGGGDDKDSCRCCKTPPNKTADSKRKANCADARIAGSSGWAQLDVVEDCPDVILCGRDSST